MIIFLSELHKEHLNLIHKHSTEVFINFCKLTIDYLNNGTNHKKLEIAAEKLELSQEEIQNVVHALAYLVVEGCEHNISEADFKSSLALAGLNVDQQQVLLKMFTSKKVELSAALNILQQKDPSYEDLIWRLEVQVASRSCEHIIQPMVALDFVITIPKNFGLGEYAYFDNRHDVTKENKCITPIQINSNIQIAKTASECQRIINHVLLQCDIPNLVHLTNKLEQALKEAKSQHVRKVQRAL